MAPEIRRLWQRVEIDCEWPGPRAPRVRMLFGDPRATPDLLEFLADTRVGRMPSQIQLRGGWVEDMDGLETIELEAPEEGAEASEESEEEDGPAPPLQGCI